MADFKIPKIQGRIFFNSVLGIILAWSLYECFDMYIRHPTYTDITIMDQKDAPFPAITVCPMDYNNKVLEVERPSQTNIPFNFQYF